MPSVVRGRYRDKQLTGIKKPKNIVMGTYNPDLPQAGAAFQVTIKRQ